MLSLVKASTPAPVNTRRPSRMIGRRVSANVISPLSTARSLSLRRDGERVAQEERAVRRDKLTGPEPGDDLHVAVVLQAGLDGALDEMAAVGGDPDGHRSIAFAH